MLVERSLSRLVQRVLLLLVLCGLVNAATKHSRAHAKGVVRAFRKAQELVAERWEYSPNITCISAGVHGMMKKTTTGSTTLIMPRSIGVYVRTGVPIYSGAQVYVSHKYKVVYLRQPKSSSSTIIAAMHQSFCGGKKKCLAEELQRFKQPNAEVWRDYFVFTVVRNPYARMVSAYNMMSSYLKIKRGPSIGKKCQVSFEEFAFDSYSMRAVCATQNCCAYIRKSNRFIDDFVNGHVSQQSHLIFNSDGQCAVDYIARTEHLPEDWADILSIVRKRTGLDFPEGPALRSQAPMSQSSYESARHPCLSEHAAVLMQIYAGTAHNIATQHAMDLYLLDFLPRSVRTFSDIGEFGVDAESQTTPVWVKEASGFVGQTV